MKPLLKITALKTHFLKRDGVLKAVDNVDLEIHPGETLALVGESGSGKTITALSILRLVPHPGQILAGRIEFLGDNLLDLSEKQMASRRGKKIGLILQDPLSALNPVMCVGEQIAEVLRHHFSLKRKQAKKRALQLMEKVKLPNVEKLYRSYPHQLSGGLRQRVLIAIALTCHPSLVIADEPTTALDVSIQQEILTLLNQLRDEFQTSLLLITHDLGVVAQMADRVAVMYAGKIVEQAPVKEIFTDPMHPYTRALLSALPVIDFSSQDNRTSVNQPDEARSGPPDLMNLPSGCAFHPRCPLVDDECRQKTPINVVINKNRYVKCFKTQAGS